MIEKYPTFKFVRGDTQGFVVKATFIDGTPIQQIDIKDILIWKYELTEQKKY